MDQPDNPYADELLYTQSEILQMIYGLMNVYWSRSKLTRWMFKPWFSALQTLALQIAGDEIIARQDANDAIKYWEDKL